MYYQDVTVWTVIKRFLLGCRSGAGAYKLRALQAVHRRSYCQQHLGMDQRGHADRHRDHHVVGADQIFFAITKGKKENACI